MLCARLCVRGGLSNGEGDPLMIFDDEEESKMQAPNT